MATPKTDAEFLSSVVKAVAYRPVPTSRLWLRPPSFRARGVRTWDLPRHNAELSVMSRPGRPQEVLWFLTLKDLDVGHFESRSIELFRFQARSILRDIGALP